MVINPIDEDAARAYCGALLQDLQDLAHTDGLTKAIAGWGAVVGV
ncbi:hypothetical protein FHX37_1616 [Haloactinospora alba]|uniref:Uncharacterized protein n=1 Tax=Haloactinospora alba TaxID=405555 RepID=A0A543NIP0_9ACTN|nr:hypothetical protein [Haloactinospora alba]TQN31696.1 hypothetical protein FHX37_1616 [Haloactinospora alba]